MQCGEFYLKSVYIVLWYFTNTLDLQGDDTRIIILVSK